MTSTRTLLDAAEERTAAIHFWQDKDRIEPLTAADLLGRARACAKRFRQAGVERGDRVALMLPTSPECIAALLGAWGCGAAVVVLPHDVGRQSGRLDVGQLQSILGFLQPRLIVLDDERTRDALTDAPAIMLQRADIAGLGASDEAFAVRAVGCEPAIIQLTSGSTALPKGISLSHAQIAANCEAIRERVAVDAADHVVSWLPFNHDMGLSAVTVPLWTDAAVTLIPTERFVQSPSVWLEAISRQRGTISPSPAFAYALLARCATRLARQGIDLSSWRYAWIGAEPVFERHLRAFADAMRPLGLDPTVLQPAYGLAEAVVAVSCGVPGRRCRTIHVDRSALRTSGEVRVHAAASDSTVPFVSNGTPLSNVAVEIVNDQGQALTEGRQGTIRISGPSIATGYLNGIEPHLFAPDGGFDTGDVGFMLDGELYISGRAKDVVIRGGLNVSPQPIEWAVEGALGLRAGQVAAFSSLDHAQGREEVVVVVSRRLGATAEADGRLRSARAVVRDVGIEVDRIVFAAAGSLPKTTSGKIQRGAARQMYLQGEFAQHTAEIE
jgi:fatty-acyl-CoA synthase